MPFYDLCLGCTEGVLAQTVPVFQSHGWLSFGFCRSGDIHHILLTNNQLWIEYVHYHHNQEETTASDWFCAPHLTNARSSLQEGDICRQKVMTILYSNRQNPMSWQPRWVFLLFRWILFSVMALIPLAMSVLTVISLNPVNIEIFIRNRRPLLLNPCFQSFCTKRLNTSVCGMTPTTQAADNERTHPYRAIRLDQYNEPVTFIGKWW